MKSTFAKILPVGLALALLLTGCSKNHVKLSEKAIKKVNKAYETTVAKYNGGKVSAGEMMAEFTNQYNQLVILAEEYGYELTQADIQELMESCMENRVRTEVVAVKFDEKYTLTQEELAQAEETAKSVYQSNYDAYYAISDEETEEAKDAQVREILTKLGMDYDSTYDAVVMTFKNERMYIALGEEITEVTRNDVKENYDKWVTDDSDTYYGHWDDFAYAMTQPNINSYWMPSGFRTVKNILITVDESLMTAYNDAVAAYDKAVERVAELEASKEGLGAGGLEALEVEMVYAKAAIEPAQMAIDAALITMSESVQDKLVDIYTRLAAGEDFDVLVEEYCEDPSMLAEPTKTRGYYISDKCTIWDPVLQEEALALANPGDYSQQPVVTANGLNIVYYETKVKAGPVSYEDNYETLYNDTLTNARQEHYNNTIEDWFENCKASYDISSFIKAFSVAAE